MVDPTVLKFIGELRDGILLGKFRKKLLDHFTVCLLFGNRPLHGFEAVFGAVKAFSEAVAAFLVFALILCNAGVFRDAFLDESCHRVHIDL